jgi:hypothetical protein
MHKKNPIAQLVSKTAYFSMEFYNAIQIPFL